MNTEKKSQAQKFLEKLNGGPLKFGQIIWAIREANEYSQTEFAKKLSVSRAHLCDIEKGRRTVSPERAARWAKKLGHLPEQFVRLALQAQLEKAGLNMTVEIKTA